MTSKQLIQIANELYKNAGGKEDNVYSIVNGKWVSNGKELDAPTQVALTSATGVLLAQKLVASVA